MTPASARGEAMGLHNSALTVGVALGGPLAGVAMDTWSPAWGFAAVGGVGVVVAALALPAELRRRRSVADLAASAAEAEDGPGSLRPGWGSSGQPDASGQLGASGQLAGAPGQPGASGLVGATGQPGASGQPGGGEPMVESADALGSGAAGPATEFPAPDAAANRR